MYIEFNKQYPAMRPLKREVYGKLIFLAGVENEALREHVYRAGIRDILVSYFYLRNRSLATIEEQLQRFDNVILDSGGFTFIQAAKKGAAIANSEIEEYTKGYIEFCDKMKHCFNYAFEMDMTWQVSTAYRNAHIAELRDRGVRVVPIVHDSVIDSLEENGFYDSQIVAFAGKMTGGASGEKMKTILDFEKRGVLVHGLAATDEASINRVPYFSVDSSSWVAGGKYGLTYIWNGNKITVYDAVKKHEVRTQYADRFSEIGLDPAKILADDYESVNIMNAYAWKQYIDYVRYNITKSWWLTDEEKAAGKDFLINEVQAPVKADAVERYQDQAREAKADLIRSQDRRTLLPAGASPFLSLSMAAPMQCNNCAHYRTCDAYKKDASCWYHENINVSSIDDILGAAGALVSMQQSRIGHAVLGERFLGGNIDPNVSKEVKTQLQIITTMGKLVELRDGGKLIGGPPPAGAVPSPTPSDGAPSTIDTMFNEVSGAIHIKAETVEPSVQEVIATMDNPYQRVVERQVKYEPQQAHSHKTIIKTDLSENPENWPDELYT